MRHDRNDKAVVDEKTVRGLLAAFGGAEIKGMLAAQIGEAERRAATCEAELGKLSDMTLGDVQAEPTPRRRIRSRDDVIERADRLKRQMAHARAVGRSLEVFSAHLHAEKTYYLSEGEVRDLVQLEDEED